MKNKITFPEFIAISEKLEIQLGTMGIESLAMILPGELEKEQSLNGVGVNGTNLL